MHGISWGGFNSLQIAALRPPALRAIITLCSTDDRYSDDVHYKGGLVSALDMLHWGTYMVLANGEPPDPAIAGDDRWRQLWLGRIDASTPLTEIWLEHQRRDAYWKHGSVIEDYSAITAAVYAVGGWQDGYTNAIPRLLAGLDAPRKGLIGPWGHTWPHAGSPEPAIGFLQECVRWWDHWLKDVDTGIMDEPMLRAYVQDSVRPSPNHRERPGRWVSAAGWPPPSAQTRTLHLGDGTLAAEPAPETERSIMGRQTCGFDSGAWCGEGETSDDPDDQRAEDGMSLVFDSAPLRADVHLLGFPRVVLPLRSDRTRAMVCVRLCEVFPDGASKLVTRQILNLCHRDSHEHPEPLEPGREYTVVVELDSVGHVLAAGNRVRVAVSPTYWPWAWPSPEPVTLTVHGGALELPVRASWQAETAPAFAEPEQAPMPATETLAYEPGDHAVSRSIGRNTSQLVHSYPAFHTRYAESGIELRSREPNTFTIDEADPLSSRALCERWVTVSRGEWGVSIEARSTMQADAESFLVTAEVRAFEGGRAVHAGAWTFRVPRDHV